MLKTYRFPVKGTFYYAAELAFDDQLIHPKVALSLVLEPDNPYDAHAIQIWLPCQAPLPESDFPGLLLGYVPRQLAPIISQQLQRHCTHYTQVIHRARSHHQLEIDCTLLLNLPWHQSLQLSLLSLWVRQRTQLKKLRQFLTH